MPKAKKDFGGEPPLRLEWVDPESLDDNPMNWRLHPAPQRDALDELLSDVGWAGALLYNERTGRLIDGHLRKRIAIERGLPVPVLVGNWSEEQERRILATFDPLAAMAVPDIERLSALLESVDVPDGVLEALSESAGEALASIMEPPEEYPVADAGGMALMEIECPSCGAKITVWASGDVEAEGGNGSAA